ncbi:MAG: DUF6442 family protein [Lachnospiraceae bacterium]|nr:DUF6442 family protein [Lachnospiraceae bacterium]
MNNNEKQKEEILAKIRMSKRDEGMENADIKGTKIGIIAYAVISFILILFSLPDQMNIVYTIAALSFTFCFGGTVAHYRFTKNKLYLLGAVWSVIATIMFALMVILSVMKG